MFGKAANSTPVVPSRNALRTLRQLALAGGTVGSCCALAAVTYDVHRRVRVAEQIIENKRIIHTSAPNYDAKASAQRLAHMMEAAEAGNFMGLDSMKPKKPQAKDVAEESRDSPLTEPASVENMSQFGQIPVGLFNYTGSGSALRNEARNKKQLDFEAKRAKRSKSLGKVPLDEQIRQMVLQGKEIQATNMFIKEHTKKKVPNGVSWDRRALAYHLFTENCKKGNVFIARNLFHRMEKITSIDSEIWAMMMHLLAKEGHMEAVCAIFEKHRFRLEVPVHLLEVVLRCLLESRRLSLAKWFFYNHIKHDVDGGLCGAYLDGVWKKARSTDLLADEFRLTLKHLSDLERKPTEKVFNPMIKAFIDSGKHEDAEKLVADMPVKWNVLPGCRSIGLLLYGRAASCDWESVMDGLHDMHARGLTGEKRNFARVFDRLLLEYYPTHSGRETFKFITNCINDFDIVPDRVLHRHIIEALVERGDTEMFKHITRLSQEREWKTGIDRNALDKILRARRAMMQSTPVGSWNMMKAAKRQYGMVASSRRILGTSAESYTLDGDTLAPVRHNADSSFSDNMDDFVFKKSINLYMPLEKRMEHFIHAGHFGAAKATFDKAVQSAHPIESIHLKLAAVAHILQNGSSDLEEVRQTIRKQWLDANKRPTVRYTRPFPLFVPVFFQQIIQLDKINVRESTLYKSALMEFYNICADTPTLVVKNHASTALCRRLIQEGRQPLAIEILKALYKSKWRKSHKFDQVQLKMLFRAFAVENHIRGIWWSLSTVLTRYERVSRFFVAEAERLLPMLERRVAGVSSSDLNVVQQLVELLRKKAASDDPTLYAVSREQKRKMRTKPALPHLVTSHGHLSDEPVEAMLATFDEEVEFDLMDRTTDPNDDQVLQWWDERSVTIEHRLLPEHPDYPEPKALRDERAAPFEYHRKQSQALHSGIAVDLKHAMANA
ncbi:uncharacterized protein N7498_010807 [Penicillium cinerascens]|uniref:Pentatricopeptide repeat protein n=1 Tax=Penicillium cinerascens TaxID=70096 RepID=A0A9W9J8D3_9EURO|nr:uncharacterized protein N7498_010807 [Penicillium cinerascens]KAJ5191822.1 hypothetical protein N7498_010807 [Penicillium cinerascens]